MVWDAVSEHRKSKLVFVDVRICAQRYAQVLNEALVYFINEIPAGFYFSKITLQPTVPITANNGFLQRDIDV